MSAGVASRRRTGGDAARVALAAVTAALAVLASACGSEPERAFSGGSPGGGAAAPAEPPAVASSEPIVGPLGIGRDAEAELIARLDIDVMPDGTGLPAGSGTAIQGAPLYRAQCAACHGLEGEGTPAASALVGRNRGDAFDFAERRGNQPPRTIGNWWPWATTIFDYTRRAMPMDRPGTLSDDEVYALTAWMLWKNRIIDEDAVMDAESLPAVVMPARDRFVPDDREETSRVR